MKKVSSSIENSKFGDKVLLKKSFGVKERMQPDVV